MHIDDETEKSFFVSVFPLSDLFILCMYMLHAFEERNFLKTKIFE
jgi:hypothetical protein